MAITATIALSHSSVSVNQPTTATVTISKSDAGNATVSSLAPFVRTTGSSDPTTYNSGVAVGLSDPGTGTPIVIPGSGNVKVSFQVVPFASTGSGTLDVLAEIRASDGTELRPTPATLTVTPFYQASPIG